MRVHSGTNTRRRWCRSAAITCGSTYRTWAYKGHCLRSTTGDAATGTDTHGSCRPVNGRTCRGASRDWTAARLCEGQSEGVYEGQDEASDDASGSGSFARG